MNLLKYTLIAVEVVAVLAAVGIIVALLREEWANRHSVWAGWEDLPVTLPVRWETPDEFTARMDAEQRPVARDDYLRLGATWRNDMLAGVDTTPVFGRHAIEWAPGTRTQREHWTQATGEFEMVRELVAA